MNLVEVFQKTYPVDCLKLLQCLIDWKERPIWILRVLGYWRSPQHPLRHLLLIRLLQCSAKEFFQPV
ncbi:TnsD family Tn7-like transposition protein [Scytonema hofmannii]|uniref:TnsD family Tn7-like transposition protein n=1 Tax=Scytonema hofmannii TaxID=34078 RepID=UPI001314F7DE